MGHDKVCLLLVLASLGCRVVIQNADDSARSDTTVVLSAHKAESGSVAPPSPSIPGTGVIDSTARPTADLEILKSELAMPIAGIRGSDLHDTFYEKRGGGTRPHEALDIMAARGTPVLSASSGRVLKLHNSKDGGLMVYAADASNRFVLMYAHLDRYAEGLSEGKPLRQGEIIGYVGTTGDAAANAPHLHFAIAHPSDVKLWWTGTAIDPYPLLHDR